MDKFEKMSRHEKKLLLLRTLGIHEGDITAVQTGEKELGSVLKERIDEISGNPNDFSQAAIVCQNIRLSKASFDTLEPDEFLQHIEELKAKGGTFDSPTENRSEGRTEGIFWEKDIFSEKPGQPKQEQGSTSRNVYAQPFRRIVARLLDLSLCVLVSNTLCRVVVGVDPTVMLFRQFLTTYFIYALMFVIEPLLLVAFGTTPGKYLMGVKIFHSSGRKLELAEAYKRSGKLLLFGFGLMVPIISLFSEIRAIVQIKRGYEMPWDTGTKTLVSESRQGLRLGLCIGAIVLISVCDPLLTYSAEMPNNKLPITVTEFYENISKISKYNGITLDGDIEFVPECNAMGEVTGVSFSCESKGLTLLPNYSDEMYVAFLSLVGAAPGANGISFQLSGIYTEIGNYAESFSVSFNGYQITNEVDRSGYVQNILTGGYYCPEGTDCSFKQTFRITALR